MSICKNSDYRFDKAYGKTFVHLLGIRNVTFRTIANIKHTQVVQALTQFNAWLHFNRSVLTQMHKTKIALV